MERSEGNESCISDPSEPSRHAHMYSTCAVIKIPEGDEGGSGEESHPDSEMSSVSHRGEGWGGGTAKAP